MISTVQAFVLAAMDQIGGGGSHRDIVQATSGRRPADVFDTLCELEDLGFVSSALSEEVDRFGRPTTSTWVLTPKGRDLSNVR